MNKELWGKTTDLPSHFVTHFSTPWKKKKKHSANPQDASFNQRSRAWICTQSCNSSPLSISLSSPIFLFLSDFRALSLCCLFSPLYIFYSPSPPCFFFSFIFSSLSSLSLSCWRVGPRLSVHKGTAHAHTQRHNSHIRAAQAAVCRELLTTRDPLLRR